MPKEWAKKFRMKKILPGPFTCCFFSTVNTSICYSECFPQSWRRYACTIRLRLHALQFSSRNGGHFQFTWHQNETLYQTRISFGLKTGMNLFWNDSNFVSESSQEMQCHWNVWRWNELVPVSCIQPLRHVRLTYWNKPIYYTKPGWTELGRSKLRSFSYTHVRAIIQPVKNCSQIIIYFKANPLDRVDHDDS